MIRIVRQTLPSIQQVYSRLQDAAQRALPRIGTPPRTPLTSLEDELLLLQPKSLQRLASGDPSYQAYIRDCYPFVTPDQLTRPVPTLLINYALLSDEVVEGILYLADQEPTADHKILYFHNALKHPAIQDLGYGLQWLCSTELSSDGSLPPKPTVFNGRTFVYQKTSYRLASLYEEHKQAAATMLNAVQPHLATPEAVSKLGDFTAISSESDLRSISTLLVEREGVHRLGPRRARVETPLENGDGKTDG